MPLQSRDSRDRYIGHLAVQIAKARGAYVVGTARAENHALLAVLGADEAIDYTRADPGAVIRGMDVVLDLVGGDTAVRSLPSLRDGGILIGVSSGTATAEAAAGRRVRVTYLLVEPDHRGLEAIAARFDAGRLAVHVSQTFPAGTRS
jgi:NADPH:quinone reductase-like Zn-dependent oxidoreductase